MKQHCANVFLQAFPGFLMNVAHYFFGRHSLVAVSGPGPAQGQRRPSAPTAVDPGLCLALLTRGVFDPLHSFLGSDV